jgi:hypothetical protein
MVTGAFGGISVTNDPDQNIWVLTAGANNKLKLHSFELYSASIVAEILDLELRRESTAGAGDVVSEQNLDEDDGAITAVMITLDLSPGTPDGVLAAYQWEQLGPLIYMPTPAMQPVVQEGGRIALNLGTALGGTTLMSGHVVWEEI